MSDAINRRMENHPTVLIENALKALDDPSLKISYEDRMEMVEPLLRAKFFGQKGGIPSAETAPPAQPPQENQNG